MSNVTDHVLTITQGTPVFRNETMEMWPRLIAERPRGPSTIVSSIIRAVNPEEMLENFKKANQNQEITWLRYDTPHGVIVMLHIVGMRVIEDSRILLYMQENVVEEEPFDISK